MLLPQTSLLQLRRICAAMILFGSFALSPGADAPEPKTPSAAAEGRATDALVIKNRKVKRDGREVDATLTNVLDAVRERYPAANITVIGLQNARISDLHLPWRKTHKLGLGYTDPPLVGVLRALGLASDIKFEVIPHSDHDVILHAQQQATARTAQIVSLRPLLGRGVDAFLERQIAETEREYAEHQHRYGDAHPRMKELSNRIQALKARRADARVDPKEANAPARAEKLIREIRELTEVTLSRLDHGSPPPEMQFHVGTSALIIVGHPEAVDIAVRAVHALGQP